MNGRAQERAAEKRRRFILADISAALFGVASGGSGGGGNSVRRNDSEANKAAANPPAGQGGVAAAGRRVWLRCFATHSSGQRQPLPGSGPVEEPKEEARTMRGQVPEVGASDDNGRRNQALPTPPKEEDVAAGAADVAGEGVSGRSQKRSIREKHCLD